MGAPRALKESDDLTGFRSGVEVIDSWLHKRAHRAMKSGTAVTYVSLAEGRVAGFYSLSSQSICRRETHGWIARNTPEQIPVFLLGMLAVDERFQGRGLGADLLADAYRRSASAAETVGARALVVDPYDDNARSFYTRWGFSEIPGTDRMFAKLAR